MSKSSTLILLGVLLMLVPYSGLPSTIRTLLAVVFGAIVLGIGVMLRAEAARALESATPPAPAPAPANESTPESSVLEAQPASEPEPTQEHSAEPLAF